MKVQCRDEETLKKSHTEIQEMKSSISQIRKLSGEFLQ
jgi:hypothetical protein